MKTILVLSGVTTREMIDRYPCLPTLVFEDVGHIPVDQLQSRVSRSDVNQALSSPRKTCPSLTVDRSGRPWCR